jgi:hypothetical protein
MPEHVSIATLGLTGLSDPNDDRIVFWDDSAGNLAFLDIGSSLSISTTTLDAIQDIRATAGPSFDHLHLTVAIGTAPLSITSTTMSPNLNADMLDGYHASAFLGLPALTDPNDDRIVFWDDSEGALAWLDLGDSLKTTLAVLDTIQDIRTTASPTFAGLDINGAIDQDAESATAAGSESAYSLVFNHNKTTVGGYDSLYGIDVLLQTPDTNDVDTDNALFAASARAAHYGAGSLYSLVGLEFTAFNYAGSSVATLSGLTGFAGNNAGAATDVSGGVLAGMADSTGGEAVTVTSLYGIRSACNVYGDGAGSSVTITDVKEIATSGSSVEEYDSGSVAITNWYGAYLANVTVGGWTPTITNQYGLYIEEPTVGTNKWGAYIAGGLSYFGGQIQSAVAGGTAPFVIASNTMSTNLNADLLDGSHAAAFEPALGNPAVTGYVLSSTDAGVRSWIAAGGALALDDLTDVNAPTPTDQHVLTWDNATSRWISQAAPGAGGGAPTDATYIVQTANGTLSAEQAMGALATGLVKNTTTTGVQAIAVEGTDYIYDTMFKDEFGDASIGWWWKTYETSAAKTIAESGSVVTIAVTATTNADWWTAANNAPRMFTGIPGYPCEIICKINSATINKATAAGVYISYDPDNPGAAVYISFDTRKDTTAAGTEGIHATLNGTNYDTVNVTTLPIWLKIGVTSDCRLGNSVMAWYSTDGTSWTRYQSGGVDWVATNFGSTANLCAGLYVKNWTDTGGSATYNAVSAPFEFFKIVRPYGA